MQSCTFWLVTLVYIQYYAMILGKSAATVPTSIPVPVTTENIENLSSSHSPDIIIWHLDKKKQEKLTEKCLLRETVCCCLYSRRYVSIQCWSWWKSHELQSMIIMIKNHITTFSNVCIFWCYKEILILQAMYLETVRAKALFHNPWLLIFPLE